MIYAYGLAIQSIAYHIQAMRETYVNNKIFCIVKNCRHLQKELSQQQIDLLANSVCVVLLQCLNHFLVMILSQGAL